MAMYYREERWKDGKKDGKVERWKTEGETEEEEGGVFYCYHR